jgi:two-component system, OmpR family, response regulator
MVVDTTIRALLIEDDARLAALTREYLERHQVVVTEARDGPTGLLEATRLGFDVVLLDVMLPGEDGFTVCRKIRERSDVPIIMLTARGEEADRVMGLELGADDYLQKPFSPRELLARMHAVVRRHRGLAGPRTETLSAGRLVLDATTQRATVGDEALPLTGYEFSLLFALVAHRGRILTREQLMELARGNPEESFDRSIDVHISRLRQKLGDDPKRPRWIKTVRGIGYQLIEGDA